MKNIFKGKTVLLTGGTGSFGKKFTEIVMKKYTPKKLIIFSRDEMKQYEMQKDFDHADLRYFIGDVRDQDRLHRAFDGVDIVVHAAALKIVPTAEYNPFETVKTNIFGAENVINTAIDNGVEKVLALSTDKAANPVNLYGATKLCAEKMFIAANSYSHEKRFSVVRYGNVFGSRGSVVPFFMECRDKGVVPITHKDMTRFWITLEQGVEYVMRCIEAMKGGEIFVPKLPSIRITDLAEAICPGCRQETVGIRPGEKLHETLVARDDWTITREYGDQFVIYPEMIGQDRDIMPGGRQLEVEFEGYRSDNNTEWMDRQSLKKMTLVEKY